MSKIKMTEREAKGYNETGKGGGGGGMKKDKLGFRMKIRNINYSKVPVAIRPNGD